MQGGSWKLQIASTFRSRYLAVWANVFCYEDLTALYFSASDIEYFRVIGHKFEGVNYKMDNGIKVEMLKLVFRIQKPEVEKKQSRILSVLIPSHL